MKDYNIERPDHDYPGYDLRMTEGKNFDSEDFEEGDDADNVYMPKEYFTFLEKYLS